MNCTPMAKLFFRVTFLILTCLTAAVGTAQAQTGTIKGTIRDEKTKEAIIGASVGVEGSGLGSATDIDGNFEIPKVPAGTHTLVINYVSYQRKTIPGLKVESGKVVVVNTALTESANQLGDVVVTAQRLTNTEVAVITEVKNAQLVAVGVSSEQIVKSQDRDAAQIARRVPGVSIQDNRFVLVRGLGQRYNAVMLNDVLTPSTEVDSRAFSFDMVPSSVIDRMLIYKSGSAELPGEFAGGVIKLYTKRAPQENFTNVGIAGGYRMGTTFEQVQQYQGGRFDWLGFDDGKRRLPGNFPVRLRTPPFSEERAARYANQLPNRWAVNTNRALPDLRVAFNMGRRFALGEKEAGTLTGINYANYNQYADVDLNFYENGADRDQLAQTYRDNVFENNVRLGVVQNFWLRLNPRHSLEFKNLFNQMGFSQTVVRNGQDITSSSNDVRAYSQRYESRSIYSGQLLGTHELTANTKVDWQSGFAYTRRTEPDWRRVRYIRPIGETTTDGQPKPFLAAIPADPNPIDAGRFFSTLNEYVGTVASNITQQFGRRDSSAISGEDRSLKLKAGFYAERKSRDFKARFFGYEGIGDISQVRQLPINEIFAPANVTGTTGKFTFEEGTSPSDQYTASNTLVAGYASLTVPVGAKITGTVGLRAEYNDIRLVGAQLDGTPRRGGQRLLSPLPSLNLTYAVSDKALVRAAYSATINRPEFRELAPFNFYDFNLNSNVVGNYTLKTATIHNADLRWELYPTTGELISLGAFYKYFRNPIESFLIYTTSGANSLSNTFVNSRSAQSAGLELEVRKSLSELSESTLLKRLSLVANASWIHSRVDLGESVLASDLGGKVDPVNVADIQDQRRPMQNQSPYLINLGAYYNDDTHGTQLSLLYNVVGPRIFAVGNLINPTVYEVPRNVLDVVLTKRLVERLELRLAVQDILNQPVRLVQDANRNGKVDGPDQTVRTFRRGANSTLGLNFRF